MTVPVRLDQQRYDKEVRQKFNSTDKPKTLIR